MKPTFLLSVALVGLVAVCPPATRATAQVQERPKVQIPDPGVPQIMTIEGDFVRAAYNDEGYVIIGCQLANRSLGEEWMLPEVGMTVLDHTPEYKLTRDALSLETPDATTLPLPSTSEFRAANTQALQARERVQRDSINYFPPMASRPCALAFFPDPTSGRLSWDQVEVSSTRACLGRRYFKVPGGIPTGCTGST